MSFSIDQSGFLQEQHSIVDEVDPFATPEQKLAIAILVDAVADASRDHRGWRFWNSDEGRTAHQTATKFLTSPDNLMLWAQLLGLDEEALAYQFKKYLKEFA